MLTWLLVIYLVSVGINFFVCIETRGNVQEMRGVDYFLIFMPVINTVMAMFMLVGITLDFWMDRPR